MRRGAGALEMGSLRLAIAAYERCAWRTAREVKRCANGRWDQAPEAEKSAWYQARMTLNHLSDDELMASLHGLCVDARRLDARVVVHLVEVEERRLHLRAACSSLFDFCVRRLRMSEGAAFRRIAAARLVRRFPSLLGHLESGAVHLSTLVMLREHLTESNVEELVAATSGKTKREVEELLARRAPRADVPATIRKLPSPSAPAASPGALFDNAGEAGHANEAASSVAPRSPARIEPLSESRYKLQLTVSGELREKLERARDLMRHRNPSGDLAVVVEQALDALVEKLERERLAKTVRPRRTVRAAAKGRIRAEVRREVLRARRRAVHVRRRAGASVLFARVPRAGPRRAASPRRSGRCGQPPRRLPRPQPAACRGRSRPRMRRTRNSLSPAKVGARRRRARARSPRVPRARSTTRHRRRRRPS